MVDVKQLRVAARDCDSEGRLNLAMLLRSTSNEMEQLRLDKEVLAAYADGNQYLSDFRTATEMRQELCRLRGENNRTTK